MRLESRINSALHGEESVGQSALIGNHLQSVKRKVSLLARVDKALKLAIERLQAETKPYLTKLKWNTKDRWLIEREMLRHGGKINNLGEGIPYHFKRAMMALWPMPEEFQWHRWSDLYVKSYASEDEVAVMGPASSGKTYCAAACALTTFWVWPNDTAVLLSTDSKSGLELRVWGALKKLYNFAADRRHGMLPGRFVQSQTRFTTSAYEQDDERPEDWRNGIIGVACRIGDKWRGISNFVGIKNRHVILIGDEGHLMPPSYIDTVANIRKNSDPGRPFSWRFIIMGNPKDPTDGLGKMGEPELHLGGWPGFPRAEKTQTWRTRSGGLAIQFCGTDSPNIKDGPPGTNPFRGLITQAHIDKDLATYGSRDAWQFQMMDLGIMPMEASEKRVLTASLLRSGRAFEQPIWARADTLTYVAGLDAAYRGTGGDRCVLRIGCFGQDINGRMLLSGVGAPIIVPIKSMPNKEPEEQIVEFCMEKCAVHGIPPENLGLDSTGRGTLVGAFARIWSPAIVPIEFGGVANDRHVSAAEPVPESEAYGKMVTALWFASRRAVEGNQLRNVSLEASEEACARSWDIVRSTATSKAKVRIDVEAKKDTKLRLGRSPDLWDAEVVMIEMARRRGFVLVSSTPSSIQNRQRPVFLDRISNQARQMRRSQELIYQ